MKKILSAIMCAGLILISASGCTGGTSGSGDTATGDEAKSMNAADYENNLEGICNYFAAFGYVNPKDSSKYTDMDASLIGAKEGKKFSSPNLKNTTIELYEFDTDKSVATADEIISSVKSNGTFSILELPEVKAYLSDNGKFLMIYNDTSINDDNPDTEADNYQQREEVLEKFKAFHK